MRTRTRLQLAALTATFIFTLAVGAASARNFEIVGSTRGFRFSWTAAEIRYRAEGLTPIRCPLTFEGTFHRATIAKVSGSLIGFITRVIAPGTTPPCTTSNFTVLQNTVPWHVRYDSFTGTLPTITGIRLQIIGAGIFIRSVLLCLAFTTATNPMYATLSLDANGRATGVSLSGSIPMTGEAGLCGNVSPAEINGNGTATYPAETMGIQIRLIS